MPEFIADSVTLNGNPGTRADVMAVLKGDADKVPVAARRFFANNWTIQ